MSKTLILLFHPDLKRSRANAALAAAAARLPGAEVADMYALYPDGKIDADREVARLLSADRIVLQFPIQWYPTEGRLLEGKPLLVVATAGNVPEAYQRGGANKFTMEELLRPLEATAHRCSLPWQAPFLVYRADKLDDLSLHGAAKDYAAILETWRRQDAQRFLVEAWG